VIAENFGFMLVWGDAPFVPFFYSIGGLVRDCANPEGRCRRTKRRRCASCPRPYGLWGFAGTIIQQNAPI